MSDGKNNTGYGNDGCYNSGSKNTGDSNSGHRNSGNLNSGNGNSGDMNSGDHNSGDNNSGDMNTGSSNTGNQNSGDQNSGERNSGDLNSGNCNSGDLNTGGQNSGNRNSGYMNKGDCNGGAFNSCDNSNGVFCNQEDRDIRIFNMPSGMSLGEFYESKYWAAIRSVDFPLTEWVDYTVEEMEDVKKAGIGGYLKENSYEEACAKWWAAMSEENREIVKSLPNFDLAVFREITGIDLSESTENHVSDTNSNTFTNDIPSFNPNVAFDILGSDTRENPMDKLRKMAEGLK